MKPIADFPFFPLSFDKDGKLTDDTQLTALEQHVAAEGDTDVVFIAHGFRNSEADATNLYTQFLTNLRTHLATAEFASLAPRKFAVAAVFWPSKSFKEAADSVDGGHAQSIGGDDDAARNAAKASLEDLRDSLATPAQKTNLDKAIGMLDGLEENTESHDEFVKLVLSLTDGVTLEKSEGLDELRSKDGADVLANLKTPVILPTTKGDDDEGGATSFTPPAPVGDDDGTTQSIGSFFGSIFGAVGTLANVTTWYVMKNRSGTVGAAGVADAVRAIKTLPSAPRVHLVGHSLGGRLMASASKALANPLLQPNSLTLLEAAFSHYGFSAKGPNNPEGFFRAVIDSKVVKGPMVATFSSKDVVVGLTYSVASRLARDNTKAVGDANDQYGGIGRNGTQNCDVGVLETLHAAGVPYADIPVGKVLCYDGSADLIKNHSDITNPAVTYLFASALTHTA